MMKYKVLKNSMTLHALNDDLFHNALLFHPGKDRIDQYTIQTYFRACHKSPTGLGEKLPTSVDLTRPLSFVLASFTLNLSPHE